MTQEHTISSEVAYDLVQDHMDTILALLDRPLHRSEVLERIGCAKKLDRLVRHGLVTAEGDDLRAVSGVFNQLRQESMMSFLERYVVPALAAGLHNDAYVTLETRYLKITESAMRALRQGPVQQKLFSELIEISDRPAKGVTSRLSVLVVGTSRVITEAMETTDEALKHVQQASVQRSTPGEKDLAVLSQLDFLADNGRYIATLKAIEDFLSQFDAKHTGACEESTYHLTVASHWAQSIDDEPSQTGQQLC